jgi:hypothetical protein
MAPISVGLIWVRLSFGIAPSSSLLGTGRLSWMVGEAAAAASTLPPGLTQTFEQVGVVFRPKPGHSLADIHVERGRRE